MKISSKANNLLTVINLANIVFVFVCGATKIDSHNWNIQPTEASVISQVVLFIWYLFYDFLILKLVNRTNSVTYSLNGTTGGDDEYGTGGIFPFGLMGMMKGASKCFFAFVGFDCIATLGM
jgi:amino acid transporter